MKKRFLSILFIIFCIFFGTSTGAKPGDVLGSVYYSDIGAYINNYPIASFNVEGNNAIIATDLRNYGFSVIWDEDERCVNILKSGIDIITPKSDIYRNSARKGTTYAKYLETDIKAKIGGRTFPCYNIDGKSVVLFRDLSVFGKVTWDEETRTAMLTIDGMPSCEFVPIPESPMPVGKVVALTYDDGPSIYTERILDSLGRYGAKATFYVLGERVGDYPYTLRRTFDMGMEIGSHSYSHPRLIKISLDEVTNERALTDDAISTVTGEAPKTFRPPYGERNAEVLAAFGKPGILWSLDTRDWESRNAQKIVDEVMKKVKDGDIILMHDLYEATAEATEIMIPRLIEEGYTLVTVSELAEIRGVNMEVGKTYSQMR